MLCFDGLTVAYLTVVSSHLFGTTEPFFLYQW